MRVNISIPKQLHEETKKYCKENMFTVSSLIAFLLTIEVFNEQVLKFKPVKNLKPLKNEID